MAGHFEPFPKRLVGDVSPSRRPGGVVKPSQRPGGVMKPYRWAGRGQKALVEDGEDQKSLLESWEWLRVSSGETRRVGRAGRVWEDLPDGR